MVTVWSAGQVISIGQATETPEPTSGTTSSQLPSARVKVIIRFAVRVPQAMGVNVTSKEQDENAGCWAVLHISLVTAKSPAFVPEMLNVMVHGRPPQVRDRVTDFEPPMSTQPKLSGGHMTPVLPIGQVH